MTNLKILFVGERLKYRSFNGANKALPVLASALHNAGYTNVLQLDMERPDLNIEDVLREANNADFVAFAGAMTQQLPEIDVSTRRIYEHLKNIRKDVPIIVGGYASKSIEDVARETPWVTAYFNGEGEEAIVKIADSLAKGIFKRDMPKLEGMCYLDDSGKFYHSSAPRVKNPTFSNIDQNIGFNYVQEVHDIDIFTAADGRQLKTVHIYTQRGCPWVCGYCNKSTEENTVTRLSEESLRKQLRDLKSKGFEAVYLDVDTFTVNEKAARLEARILKEEGFVWGSNTRIDRINLDLMRHFVDNRCVYMYFGVEHTMPEVAVAIGKFNGSLENQIRQARQYPERVKEVFKSMREVGLPSSYFTILGLPKAKLKDGKIIGYEPTTFEDDIASIKFGLEVCEPDFLNFNMLRFMPGSLAADMPSHPAYSCVRPSGDKPITAGYFLPRVAEKLNYKVPENHKVYRLCESVGMNQPTTTAMDPERVYATISYATDLINERIDSGKKATRIFVDDKGIRKAGLVRRDAQGKYSIAPLKEFEGLNGK